MKIILIIGMNTHTIDYTNPELPKGITAEMIEQGTKATVNKLSSIGFQAELFLIDAGTVAPGNLEQLVRRVNYDGIVVGNGIRGVASNFILFEQIINIIHENAPKSKIIFNTLPNNTDEAVKRWL
ncbi:hypothetical protein IC229_32720 [Spirosoma sp. BT702]|uniref:Uncharacterized protein n=2 Tax=Spirosoma profusum TaxID=2771354 RepID=A0A927AVX8_9BACT|nr:hypothetical protein [Spirosoma profusum]